MKSVENFISWLITDVKAQIVASLEISPANTLLGYSFSLTIPGFILTSVILLNTLPCPSYLCIIF